MTTSPVPGVRKKEKTIRSETTKVFLVVFAILATVGLFTIVATFNGAKTFNAIKGNYLKQFQAAEVMKQESLDIIGIFYLLSGDQDIELQMQQMQRYDGLVAEFDKSRGEFEKLVQQGDEGPEKTKTLALLAKTKEIFDILNNSCREMTIGMMEGRKADAKIAFTKLNGQIDGFKKNIDELETIVKTQLTDEANRAQGLLQNTSYIGIVITILAIFITVGLIYYLMKFLSVSLLPISNLMHNMRQAVFSIDKTYKVISPVSNYSSTVFGGDIIGKSVFDVTYKDLDAKSEALAGAKTALTSVFGEDDMQWMLAEDSLPAQVKSLQQDGSSKILKLTYTPLWNKLKQVENIMIVADDVTEIEALRAEALEKQGEVAIIQGLVGVDRGDLESFLNDTQRMLKECLGFLTQLEKNPESRKVMFRHLHTIKGNSRLYNLNTISEIVHGTEATVVEINKRFDDKEPVPSELYERLNEGLSKTEDILSTHCRMGNKLFGLVDISASRKEDSLHNSMAAIEFGVTSAKAASPDDTSKIAILRRLPGMGAYSVSIERAVEQAHDAALYFDSLDLAESLDALKGTLAQADQSSKLATFTTARDIYCAKFASAERRYDFEPGKWVSVLQKIFDVTQAAEELKDFESDREALGRLEASVSALHALSDADGLIAVRTIAAKMMLDLVSGSPVEKKTDCESNLNSLWSYVALVFSLDSSFAMDQTVRTSLTKLLGSLPADIPGSLAALESVTGVKVLMLSYLRAMARGGIHPKNLAVKIAKHLKISEKAVVDLVLGATENRAIFGKLSIALRGNFVENPALQTDMTTALSAVVPSIFTQAFNSISPKGALRIDFLRAMGAFVQSGDGASENTQQTVEISAQIFNKIRACVEELTSAKTGGNDQTVAALNEMIKHAFDYPLKAFCKKMEPMVKDLSKRLGKDIVYKVTGDEVAVERETAYSLRDALVHMIRNSLDHGFEKPEERAAAGKAGKATLEICCKYVGKTIELVVKDDGRGINVDRVVKKAVEMGEVQESAVATMSQKDKLALVFISRLTTKEEVTNLSGRGVGMDAVKSTIDKLGGHIDLTSNLGTGTEFKFIIPLSKADTTVAAEIRKRA